MPGGRFAGMQVTSLQIRNLKFAICSRMTFHVFQHILGEQSMSKFVKVNTELRELSLIKRALDDLKMVYQENATFTHRWSGFTGKVPLVVRHEQVTFGLRQVEQDQHGERYEVIGDDMQLRQIRAKLDRIGQRYAYHKVLAETEKAGFSLVEEQTDKGNVIRLTVRRWQ
jgi:hypothetical protein